MDRIAKDVCDKDCENKNYIKDDYTYLIICNNCIHNIKRDHFVCRRSVEELVAAASPFNRAMYKLINFFTKNSG